MQSQLHMQHCDRMRRAFTLIELLMVVAIIAILASIAIPNMLEAQTRAKLARVKADIRTLATGMESYAVDYNRMPYCNPAQDHAWLSDIPMLTTPIAYLTSLPLDPFPPLDERDPSRLYYRYYPVAYWQMFYPEMNLRNWKWIVMSNAPDRRIDINRANAQDAVLGYFWMVYDPTNGTISKGDIWSTNEGFVGGL